MSGGNASYVDATAQRDKLEPPRSLQGVEDAEMIWDTIARRFPNTAPLLCEMETVIERAEDLLQQLRATSCTQGVDTSSSFHTPDSRESNTTISMVSDIESFAEETNPPEQVAEQAIENLEEARVTVQDIREKVTEPESQRGDEQTIRRKEQRVEEYHLNSPARLDEVVQHFKTSSTKCHSSQGESDANVTDSGDKRIDVSSEERLAEIMAEKSSLEGWTKAVDNALREWRDDTENIDASGDNNSETRPNVDRNTDGRSSLTDGDGACEKITHESYGPNDIKVIKSELQDSVAESFTVIANRRSPLAILEEYAKRCKVSIKYEYKQKPNLYVINGDLCGFRAMSCAATQDLAKNELAAKILWMVAERQMDGSKLSSFVCGLSDFSRGEMLEIIAFNQGELKNASQKIYKFCLERGKPAPEYSIRNSRTNQGFVYMAQCAALGYIGVGQGLRKDGAKIAAAENLYQKYSEAEQQLV
ncbi:uncharacterized protein LOC116847431 [Odontomachus brunneus]|uniref:uncharacterized protein LOC116847431 n=1 Tax=Odontomachus brunneus TaxID=486640 RepID=UPI0013F1B351|nr:uncharacterized protein LOC116847431 [Odontomachus brunneus]